KGAAYRNQIGKNTKEQLLKLAENNQTTLFTVLFTAYLQLLSRLTHRQEVCCSIISAGREQTVTHNIIGFFVNTLLFKIEIDENEPFNALIKKVAAHMTETRRHQEYPLEIVCEELKMKYPEVPVTINMLNISEKEAKEELPSLGPDSHTGLGPVSHTGLGPDGNALHVENYRDVKFDLEPYFTEYGNGIDIFWAYKKKMFQPQTIEQIAQRYIKYLDYFAKKPDHSLRDRQQQTAALWTPEDTGAAGPRKQNENSGILIDRFERRVLESPGNIAVKTLQKTYTYSDLNRTANRIARQVLKTAPGNTVGLFFQHGSDMIAALLGTLKAGKTYLPLSVEYPGKRLDYMLADSGAALLLTNTPNEPAARRLPHTIPMLNIDEIKPAAEDENNPHRAEEANKIAYILYTSGTTGRPKGVAQTHANADYYIRNWIRVFSITAADRMTLLSSFCHDGSVQDMFSALHTGAALYPYNMKDRDMTVELSQMLIEEKITIWHSVPSLFSYFSNALLKDKTFPQLRLILLGGEAVRRHEVDMLKKHYPQSKMANVYGQTESSVSTISLMDRYYRYKKPLIGAPLDETQIIIAGETGNPLETLEVGEILVASPYIAPGYWNRPEATAKACIQHKTFGKVYRTGDLGRQLADGAIEFLGRRDHQVKIRGYRVEPGEIETNLLEHAKISETAITLRENEEGEKYLCAYYVADGPIETIELRNFLLETLPDYMIPTYFTRLEKMPLTPGGKTDRNALPEPAALHTLQQYTPPRNDTEIKLTRIWAETLNMDEKDIGIDTDFFLVGGHSLRATIMVSKIHKQLDIKLPLAEIFKNSTVRTQAEIIKKYTQEKYEAIQPTEKKEYYKLSAAQKRLYILQQMEQENMAYNMPTIIPLTPLTPEEPVTPEGPVTLEGKNVQRLEKVFKQLIQRHDSLRTSFHIVNTVTPEGPVAPNNQYLITDNQSTLSFPNNQSPITNNQFYPVQVVHETVEFRIETNARAQTFFRPFDLTRAPLIRVGVIEATDTESEKSGAERALLLDMHHIITDATSLGVLEKEFFTLVAGDGLPPLKRQYKDYAEWQNNSVQKKQKKEQEKFWVNRFSDDQPILNLPTDYLRPAMQSFEGNNVSFVLNKEATGKLRETAKENEVTLYMTILAIFSILLSKLSGQEDIVIGTPTAGRRHADLEKIIGMFVNTLPMRNYPGGEKNIAEYLREVKNNTLDAFENQEYPFEELVETLSVRRDTSRNPIFDVMFNILNQPENKKQDANSYSSLNTLVTTSKFDLTLTAYDTGEELNILIEYCTKLFKEETIKRFITYFNVISQAISKAPRQKIRQKIRDIEIITEEEKHQILYEFNDTAADYPRDKTIHQLFGEQVEKTPDKIGIVGSWQSVVGNEKIKDNKKIQDKKETIEGKESAVREKASSIQYPVSSTQLTYRELNEKANRMARILQSKGVEPSHTERGTGTIVAIIAERSIEMIIALLGILKTGAAYLPIAPQYPKDRINYMLKDSNAKIVLKEFRELEELQELSESKDLKEFDELGIETIDIYTVNDIAETQPGSSIRHPAADAQQPAYIIYTSGSTGKPKGVIIAHRSVVNTLFALHKKYPFMESDVYLFKTYYIFDVSVTELFGWFFGAGKLSLLEKDGEKDPGIIVTALQKQKVTHINFVPSMFNAFVDFLDSSNSSRLSCLRYIFLAGETLLPGVVETFRRLGTGISLENVYGPTEATIYATWYSLAQWSHEQPTSNGIPIGKPLPNLTIRILDIFGKLQPTGVPGELCITGDGLALGYLNNPELTSEKFVEASG
ncbi:MAG: amino acid adenylation domain-containing protein, partial [bacterium]|nr:amino acid adenylation domain-containing protein [bacterium]